MKRLFLIFLLAVPSFIAAEEFRISDLNSGMFSYPSPDKIPDNAASVIENFYTDIESVAVERNGFEKRDTTQLGAPSSVTGLWEFVDNTGQQWIISFSSKTFYKNQIGQTPSILSTQTVTTIPDCAPNLGKLWCVNGTDVGWSFDGSTRATVSGMPLGTLIEAWRTRLVIGNITGAQSTLRFSADGDGTSWTLGGNPTDPFAALIGGANDGFPITCLWGSYLDNLVAARKRDTWFGSGFDQDDFELRNVSKEIGCIQSGSMREFDGSLLMLSSRGMEELRGYTFTHISEPIRNITDTVVKNTSGSRSLTLTSQGDWAAGTISPTDYLSSTVTIGSLTLSTNAALSSSVDTSSDNFVLGNLERTTATYSAGNLLLSPGTVGSVGCCGITIEPFVNDACTTNSPYYLAQEFTSTFERVLTKITIYDVTRFGSPSMTVNIYTSVANAPGTLLHTQSWAPSSDGNVDINLTKEIQISTGLRYFVQLVQNSCSSNYITVGVYTSAAGLYTSTDGTHLVTNVRFGADPSGFAYPIEGGTFTSRAFDMGFSTHVWRWNWSTFNSSFTTPDRTGITFKTQTSADGSTWDTAVTLTTGTSPTSTVKRYIRYIAEMTTSDRSTSPVVTEITVNKTRMLRPAGFFTSAAQDTGGSISAWSPVSISDQKEGGNISYEFNSSSNSSVSLFLSTGWIPIVSGGIYTGDVKRYFAIRSSFTAAVGTAAVFLNDFQTSWSEGVGSPPVVSWNYDRRYWLAYTTATSAPYNDRVLIYQRNRTWTLFSGINAASFTTWRDALYFGNSIGNGYVYKFDVGTSDDSSPITSRILFKSHDLGIPTQEKDLQNLYTVFLGNAASFTGSFSLTYDLDQLGQAFSLGSADLTEGTGQVAAKFPFSLSNPVQGREIQYSLLKSGTGNRLKLYGLKTVFAIKEDK